VLLKIYTDEGITGVGESSIESKEIVIKEAISDLGRYLIGEDPFNIEEHWYRIFRDGYWGAGAILTGALSAVDGAMWDIKGKALNVPVYQLLGGKFRDRIRLYANRWFFGANSPDELAKKAEETVMKGYTALKWDPFGKAEWSITKSQLKDALESIKAVKNAVGDEVDILIEGHGRFNIFTSIKIARELEEFEPMFFEEPVMPENVDALAEVREKSPVPIAAGERFYTKHDFKLAIERRAVDIVQPDLRVAGGITEGKKISAIAEAYFLPVAPHNIHGPVGTYMTLHLMASIPNALILEYTVEDVPWKTEVFDFSLKIKDGYAYIPDEAGLGIDFDEKTIEKYPFKPMSLIYEMFE
jgi:galactonate dehydratase